MKLKFLNKKYVKLANVSKNENSPIERQSVYLYCMLQRINNLDNNENPDVRISVAAARVWEMDIFTNICQWFKKRVIAKHLSLLMSSILNISCNIIFCIILLPVNYNFK